MHVTPSRIIKPADSLLALCLKQDVSEIVVAVQERRGMLPTAELMDCKLSGIPIYDFMTFMERETGRCDLNALRPSWFIFAEGFSGGVLQQSVKRWLDVTLSLVLVIVTRSEEHTSELQSLMRHSYDVFCLEKKTNNL